MSAIAKSTYLIIAHFRDSEKVHDLTHFGIFWTKMFGHFHPVLFKTILLMHFYIPNGSQILDIIFLALGY